MAYMIGMNIGNDTNGSRGAYPTAQNSADLDYLKSLGVTKLRIKLEYHLDSVGVGYTKQLALDAKAKGFTVMWGVTAGTSDTSANYATWKNTSVPNAALWASQNGIDLFLIGNEEDASVANGGFTGVTKSQVQTDVRALASSLKTTYPTMKIGYTISDQTIDDWNNNTGSLDRIGANIYGSLAVFKDNITRFSGSGYSFGAKFFVSEWNLDGGYPGTGNTTDAKALDDLTQRRDALAKLGLEAYFYTWKDGGDDGWAIRHANNTFRPGMEGLFPDTYSANVTGGLALSKWYKYGAQPNLPLLSLQAKARYRYDLFVSYCFTTNGVPQSGMWRVQAPDQKFDGLNAVGGTVSEGIGYGMLSTVFFGNPQLPLGIYDANAKTYFDGFWKFYKNYEDANGLMNWEVNADGTLGTSGGGASDADFDVAFALVMAHRIWGSTGAINYGAEATTLINTIMAKEIVPLSGHAYPNRYQGGDMSGPDYWEYYTDYFAPAWFREFYKHTNDARWLDVINTNYPVAQGQFYNTGNTFSNPYGFITDINQAGTQAASAATFGYDSIRYPWRITADYVWNGTNTNTLAHDAPYRLASVHKTRTSGDVTKLQAEPALDYSYVGGNGTPYINAPYIAAFTVGGITDPTLSQWAADGMTWLSNDTEAAYFGRGVACVTSMLTAGIMQPVAASSTTGGTTSTSGSATQTGVVNVKAVSSGSKNGITLSTWYPNGFQPNMPIATLQSYARGRYDKFVNYCFTQTGMPSNMPAGAWRVKAPDQGFYKNPNPNGTVSEGIGYGMLVTSFYGNPNLPTGIYDSTAKAKFDGLWTYYKYYRNSNGLMNWDIDSNGVICDYNGATDADLDAAMALIVAHRQWGSGGAINYAQDATNLITAIRDNEFHPANDATYPNLMTNGDGWGLSADRYMHDYFRIGWMREFYYHTGDTRWNDIITANVPMIKYFYDNYQGGLVPDGTNRANLTNNSDAYTSGYNACRIGFGLASDWLWHGANADTTVKNFITRTATKALTTYGTGDKVQAPSWDLDDKGGAGYWNAVGAQMFGVASLMSSTTQDFAAQIMTALHNDTQDSYFGDGLAAVGSMFMAGIAQPGTTDGTFAPPTGTSVTSYVAQWTSSADAASDFTTVTQGSNTVTVPSASNGNPGNAVAVTTTATSDEGDVKKELSGNSTVYFDFKLPTGATVSSSSDFAIFHAWDGTPTAYGNDLIEIRVKGSGAGYIFELVDPAASYATTAGTTVLSLGAWQSLKLVISSTDMKLYLNGNGATPEITYTKSFGTKAFGPMVWGKFYGTAYVGTMYFDNFSVGSVTTHIVYNAGPSATQSGKLSVKKTGVTNTQGGLVRVQAPTSGTVKTQNGLVRVQSPATSGGSAATRTNLVLNPSGEGTQGYSTYTSAGTPTIALDNTTALYGSQSYSIDSKGVNTDAGFLLQTAPIVNGTQYTLSYYVKTTGTVANASVTVRNGAPTTTSSTTDSPTSWTRKSITFTASGTTLEIVVGLGSYGAQSQGKANFDGFLLEAAATAGSYFDGSTAGGVWTGTANNSSSTLSSTGGTISGKLRVLLNGKNTMAGVLKVIRSGSATQSGKIRVGFAGTKNTIDGIVRIKSAQPTTTLAGKVMVAKPASNSQTGKIRVLQPNTNVQAGVVRIKNIPTVTVQGTVKVVLTGAPAARTQTGVVNVKATATKTQAGKISVRGNNFTTVRGQLRVTPAGLKQNIIAGKLNVAPADYSINQAVTVEFAEDAVITVQYDSAIL